jgi:ribosomal protein L16/L10AE
MNLLLCRYEIEMPNRSEALAALRAAARKLPVQTRILIREPGSNGLIPQMSSHT